MPYELSPEERETHLNMTGDNHGEWMLTTDDPYWIRRMEKLGIEPVKALGKWAFLYRLSADNVLVRKGKRYVSEERREALRQNARFGVRNTDGNSNLAEEPVDNEQSGDKYSDDGE